MSQSTSIFCVFLMIFDRVASSWISASQLSYQAYKRCVQSRFSNPVTELYRLGVALISLMVTSFWPRLYHFSSFRSYLLGYRFSHTSSIQLCCRESMNQHHNSRNRRGENQRDCLNDTQCSVHAAPAPVGGHGGLAPWIKSGPPSQRAGPS